MHRRFALSLVLLSAVLTSCSGQAEKRSPVATVVKNQGSPKTLHMGERVTVEGRLFEVDGKPEVLRYSVGTGARAREDCALVRGLDDGQWILRWKANWLADGKTLVAVTGIVLDERFPTYPTVGQHTQQNCSFALQTEKIQAL